MANTIDDSAAGIGYQQQLYYQNLNQNNGASEMTREELRKAAGGKYAKLIELIASAKGGKGMPGMQGMDIRDKLMMLLEVVLSDIDNQIYKTINDLSSKSQDLKNITSKQAEDNPGTIQGLSNDTSIMQAQLNMLVQNRGRFVESINNALKSFSDADANTVRRMV